MLTPKETESPTNDSPPAFDIEKKPESAAPQHHGPGPVQSHIIHNDPDEALRLMKAHEGESLMISPEEQKKLLRKIDYRLMPFLCVVYGLNYLDKTTLSYASIMGLKDDIGIGTSQYNWVASIFYFGYLAWEWPTNRLLQRLPLAKYSAANVIIWGLILAATAGIKNFGGALAVRFFLGVAEAAVSPGFALFTSQWYTQREQGLRVNIWFSFNGWGQIVGGAIAYGISVGTAAHPVAIKGWQLIFLVLGLFTAFMGTLFLYFMPDSQLNARFLTEHEKVMAVERIRQNQQGVGNRHFKWYQCKEALTDPLVWAFVVYAFFADIPNGGVSNYFSQLIVSFGFTPNQSLLLGIPGGAVQVITLLCSGFFGLKFKNRILFGGMGTTIAVVGLFVIRFLPAENSGGRLAGSSSTGFVMLLSLISSNIAGYTKKTTTAAMYLIAYCVGNIIGPQVFRPSDAPLFRNAATVLLVALIVADLTLVFIYFWCRRQNKIKAAIRESPDYVKIDGQEFMDLTDRENPEFTYSL
ncbi:major facilitator superfamily transporter allantoate [Xylariaceae sp. FL1272]|nr:major facilitator superfamily transporter allantoate [Xylariaceae sp. FL1272]